MVAIAVFEELHGLVTAGVGEPVSWVEDPAQSVLFPVIEGRALTVIVEVTEQLLLFTYVMVLVPAVMAVTSPVLEIVATAVFEDAQALAAAAVPLPVSCKVLLTQRDTPPEIVGLANTVTGSTTAHPLVLV